MPIPPNVKYAIGVSQINYDRILRDYHREGVMIRGVKTLRGKFSKDAHITDITYVDGELYAEDAHGRRVIKAVDDDLKNDKIDDLTIQGFVLRCLISKGAPVHESLKFISDISPELERLGPHNGDRMIAIIQKFLHDNNIT